MRSEKMGSVLPLAQQMDKPVGHGPDRHALDAEAVRRRIACNIGIDRIVNSNGAFFRFQPDHNRTSLFARDQTLLWSGDMQDGDNYILL